jgi:hypothetical protein
MPKITIDIDEQNKLLEQTLPWELSLTIGGEEYPTQRPTVAQVGLIARAEQLSNDEGYALLGGLFDPWSPPFRTWDLEQVQGVLAAYLAYLRTRSSKKATAIATTVRTLMAGTEKPRTSSGT